MADTSDESKGTQSASALAPEVATKKHIVTAENAAAIWNWLTTRGGLAIWRSTNPSRPGASWTTPANAADGKPTPKPTPDAADTPERIITDPPEVMVSVDAEANRVPVSRDLDRGLSQASADAIYGAVVKAGEGAYFRLEKDRDEAIIYIPVQQMPITDWLRMTAREREQVLHPPVASREQKDEQSDEGPSPATRNKSSRIVDMTEEFSGKSIIIVGAPKPKK